MVNNILLIIVAIIIGVPIACVVAWSLLKLFLALIADIGGIIFSIIVFIAIVVLVGMFL